ncbi:MAG: hypothetical protein ACJAZQ_001944 [Cognaticolwellia sp.]|jgi:uncharacterized protein (DUF2141 family)
MAIIGSLSMIAVLSQVTYAAELTVNVSKIEQGKGHLLVSLYSDKKAYTGNDAKFSAMVKATDEQEKVIFKNIPEGEYAIKMYQDENDNNELDFNLIGIPKEGYGFSNNVGQFGAPEYVKAKFIIKENTAINIALF